MTIHHDKFAYGKLKSTNDELSADALSKIIQQMNAGEDETEEAEVSEETAKRDAADIAKQTVKEQIDPAETAGQQPKDKAEQK